MCLEHQPTLPAGIEQGKVQFLKQCCCFVTGFATPGPSLRHCFWKNKFKKIIWKLTPIHYFSSAGDLLCAVCQNASLEASSAQLLLFHCLCWFWSGHNEGGACWTQWKTSHAFSQLWALSRVFLVELGCTFVPEELSGKLVLRHQQKPYVHVLILSVFLQEVLNLALQQVCNKCNERIRQGKRQRVH